MTIKDENGMMHDVASAGVANWGLGLGIAGTALGLANHGNGFGGLFGGNNTTASAMDEISKLRMENAILNADNATDKKLVEVFNAINAKSNDNRDRIDALNREFSEKLTAEREARLIAQGEQSVFNSTASATMSTTANQVANLQSIINQITTSVIPANKVCNTGCNCGCGE